MAKSGYDIKDFLEEKMLLYNNPGFIKSDPISVPHAYNKKEDIEIAAFFAATLAWGQRPVIIRNSFVLMEMMDNAPYEFILNHKPAHLRAFKRFTHRTFQPQDAIYFIKALRNTYLNHGGLENAFTSADGNMKEGLINFRKIFFEMPAAGRTKKHIANVEKNASAKRLNMFLRWMVRCDNRGVDFGLWKKISPASLYCPLDVHSGRVARKLGLLRRKHDDWRAVEELTSSLRRLDAADPVKYDFALFGLGALDGF